LYPKADDEFRFNNGAQIFFSGFLYSQDRSECMAKEQVMKKQIGWN